MFIAVYNWRVLIVGQSMLLRLSWRDLGVSCSVVCSQGGAANATKAKIVFVVAGSVKAAPYDMHVGCACCSPAA